ncbi:2-methylaconitate cis-trans isomerase PrpF [Vibrio hepatarius]|uniref:2-methylaconitate cis-trans isomerase PrpF n=1 Tax=Vibrio hepatarius TaxID=171383 RepID=UPI001C07FE7F|nr:2-methylaconitate cis-trans isomerase PrpF [Vibrio hepatarius]MBU2898840.1 2-methylaconitate cis-trans isomerase PrpF [Vibrio hepatarius]
MVNHRTNQIKVAATYMRGGTSKGVFFNVNDLPPKVQNAGKERDAFLLRVIGSPDPYSKHIDGMGGATSSTSKVVILSPSTRSGHDVDYLFGQIAIDKALVDWSGNCGNLSAAVGPFAIHAGLLPPDRIPKNGTAVVKVWQSNINKTIVIHVPIKDGNVQETGDFELDGVTFPAAEIPVDFMSPADGKSNMFPTGNLIDELVVPEVGTFNATFINAGIPTIFLQADSLGYSGTELQDDINNDQNALDKFEKIRAHGALKMGIISNIEAVESHQHTPKIAFVSKPKSYRASNGKYISEGDVDLLVRALSMGKLHHAMMGTAAVAIASASSVPGTLVNLAAGGGEKHSITFGHPSGVLKVGAIAICNEESWVVEKAVMSRSARIIMEGFVRVPSDIF